VAREEKELMRPPDRTTTLIESFLHWEHTTPHAVYLSQPHYAGDAVRVVDYTWKQVGDEARRMAAHLRSLNLAPGSSIAILGKNSAHWIIADLAIWMAGHVSVPLYPTLNAETAQYVLQHAEAKLLFLGKLDGHTDGGNPIGAALPAELPVIGLPLSPRDDVPQWNDVIARHQPLAQIHRGNRGELATIVYTSGSTGRPKGVMHSYGSMTAAAVAMSQSYDLGPDDRMLSYLPLAHVAERAIVQSASLSFGFQVYFAGDVATFQRDLKRARPTLFFSVPRLWTRFYQTVAHKLPPARQKRLFALPIVSRLVKKAILRELGLDRVRAAITGSAPLPPETIAWYRSLGLELLDCYGMSENFGVSHASRPGEVRIGYVGTTAPGCEARLADDGELLVRSPGQMLGYYKQPDLTAASLTADGFFRTGDRGEIDEAGRLKITGRVKEQFKTSKGRYVSPAPIEQKLGRDERVEVVCVTGAAQPQPFGVLMLGQDVRVALGSSDAKRAALMADFEKLLREVNQSLEPHERLDYLVIARGAWTMENGVLTPTLKLRRSVIEERYLPRADAWRQAGAAVIWEAGA
jgi:long-subunit acyl-CoA synthetase (AMP-forming)